MSKVGPIAIQIRAIDLVRSRVEDFLCGDTDDVIPVALPTGWTKTRIVLRGIIDGVQGYQQKGITQVVIWPKNQDLITTWRDSCVDWCPEEPKTILQCIDSNCCDDSKILNFHKVPKDNRLKGHASDATVKLKCGRKESKNLELGSKQKQCRFYYLNRSVFRRMAKHDWLPDILNIGLKGKIIFVIDEFHGQKIISDFYYNYKRRDDKSSKAQLFWEYVRKEELGFETSRRILWILVSATPINPVNEHVNEKDLDDQEYKLSIENEMDKWKAIIHREKKDAIHNYFEYEHAWLEKKNDREFIKIYKTFLHQETTKIIEAMSNHEDIITKYLNNKNNWLKDYVSRMSPIVNAAKKKKYAIADLGGSQSYVTQSLVFGGGIQVKKWPKGKYRLLKKIVKNTEESEVKAPTLKQKTLACLLRKFNTSKFVIFCKYHATAIALSEHLNGLFGNKKIIETSVGKSIRQIQKRFNKSSGDKGAIDYLIVTDACSEGYNLHLQDPILVHYELAFNPIRILQRLGRVWRVKQEGQDIVFSSPRVFFIIHTYSAEEEILNRLERRWVYLEDQQLAYIGIKGALGKRLTPEPDA